MQNFFIYSFCEILIFPFLSIACSLSQYSHNAVFNWARGIALALFFRPKSCLYHVFLLDFTTLDRLSHSFIWVHFEFFYLFPCLLIRPTTRIWIWWPPWPFCPNRSSQDRWSQCLRGLCRICPAWTWKCCPSGQPRKKNISDIVSLHQSWLFIMKKWDRDAQSPLMKERRSFEIWTSQVAKVFSFLKLSRIICIFHSLTHQVSL